MKQTSRRIPEIGYGALTVLALVSWGCHHVGPAPFFQPPPSPAMLGHEVDSIFEEQESNAEASKFVIYMHEFELNERPEVPEAHGFRLNESGEDHLRQIAASVREGVQFPVVVERSRTSSRPNTKHAFPVHYNPELDTVRRDVVVRALQTMGIANAEDIVVVAPAYAWGLTAVEAEQAYRNGTRTRYGQGGGFGGGGGGGGFGGFR